MLSVDHCHKTNATRGLLCGACNTGLGLFNDSPELLRASIQYLEEGLYLYEVRNIASPRFAISPFT